LLLLPALPFDLHELHVHERVYLGGEQRTQISGVERLELDLDEPAVAGLEARRTRVRLLARRDRQPVVVDLLRGEREKGE
jgi:hypothetical protein